ncbi:MAG TPA: matrixin family metalloprotease [Solirubrobacteraceae bacterium]|jgi:hypothetical protein
MARLLLTLTLATSLLLPVSAEAHRARAHGRLASRDPVGLARSVAVRYWGAVPCGGQVAVHADQSLVPGLDPNTDGWVTFDSSLGPNNPAAPASTYTHCTVSLAHWQWPTRAAMESDWNMFCLTVVHEMGHLLGHPHSLASGSVMAPVFTDESSVPTICRTTRPFGARDARRLPAR